MKISEITQADVAEYLRLESGDYSEPEIIAIMAAATQYIVGYTGIPAYSEATTGETLDDFGDLWAAYMVLCQDMYDNRTMYADTKYANSSNKVVDSILSLHARNLL